MNDEETTEGLRSPEAAARIWTRRTFLAAGAAAGLWAASGGSALAAPLAGRHARRGVRELSFANLHTGESLSKVPYWVDGRYQPDAINALDVLLRDFRTGEVYRMHPHLYDAIYALDRRLGGRRTFGVISGYRSPKTNAMLRRTSTGVAKHSYHMRGMAIDIQMRDLKLDVLYRAAKSLRAGGLGKYPRSNFIHFDVGPVRYW